MVALCFGRARLWRRRSTAPTMGTVPDPSLRVGIGTIQYREVIAFLWAVIKKKYGQDATNVGDEGGFAPIIQENKEGLEFLKTAIAKAGYTGKVRLFQWNTRLSFQEEADSETFEEIPQGNPMQEYLQPKLVCEDITGGQEDIAIPATNLVDDPPVAPSGKCLILLIANCIAAALPLEPGSSVDQVLLLCPSEPGLAC
ncbi:phosphopyruvate hydratase [Sarracenia purpurea var. burkii]